MKALWAKRCYISDNLLVFRFSDRCTLIAIHFSAKEKFYHLLFAARDFVGIPEFLFRMKIPNCVT